MTSDVPVDLTAPGEDLYPVDDEAAERKITAWVQKKYQYAAQARKPHEERWLRYYKGYRSYVRPKKPGEWKSDTWMPMIFYVIETILPRLAAQLPSAVVNPVGPEDVHPAELMEELLKWAEDKSELYPEQVKAVKSSLMYGTGVLKVQYGEKTAYNIREEPVMEETVTQVPTGELDIDEQPIMQEQPGQAQPVLDENGEPQMQTIREPYATYQGPIAEAVDLEDFFPDPVCSDIDDARFVIHRVYRDKAHLQKMFDRGVYKKPADPKKWEQFLGKSKVAKRQDEVGLGGNTAEEDKDLYALLELWTDEVVITVAGEEADGVLMRADRNPYGHGLKPFVRIVDHIVPHEFWGVGEVEPLEGIQKAMNELWNARIDNVKISLNQMFAVVMDYIMDPDDLIVRPGGVIRMREGLPLNQVFEQVDLGEVTQNAYQEVHELKDMGDMVTGVSPYQTGQDSPAYNRTATGVALISEQGNTRFSFKVQLAEHTGYKRLARMYAAILQQYLPEDMFLRIKGGEAQQQLQIAMQELDMYAQQSEAAGMPVDPMMMQQQMEQLQQQFDPRGVWTQITQDAIEGRFDLNIEAESSSQTVSARREQTLSMASQLMNDPWVKPRPIREDLLKEFGRKNVDEYLLSEMEMQLMQQQMAEQQQTEDVSSGPPQE